jgi:hypothetical protein
MVHSTTVLTYGLSMNDQKKDGFLRLMVFTIVKITSTYKEIRDFSRQKASFTIAYFTIVISWDFSAKHESCAWQNHPPCALG